MSYLKSDQLILLFSFLIVVMVTLSVNRIYSYDDPLIAQIRANLIDIDSRANKLVFHASNESFTEDKTMVYLCLKDTHGKYYDMNMLMYVALHELAHAVSHTVDTEHKGDEFRNNFNDLLKKAEMKGYYDPKKPLDYAYCPKV
jgi:hypothetical protein